MKTGITQTPTRTRTVEGKLEISDPLPRFDGVFPATESIDGQTITSYDHDLSPDQSILFRLAATEGGTLYYHRLPSSLSVTRNGQFTASTWTAVVGVTVLSGSRIAVKGDRIFYQSASDRKCYFADWNGTGFGSPFAFYTASGPVSFALLDEESGFTIEAVSEAGKPVTAYQIMYFYPLWTANNRMPGCVYTSGTEAPWSGAASFTGRLGQNTRYCYFTVDGGKRTLFVGLAESWTEVQSVIPLDVVDDTSQFRLTSVFQSSTASAPLICGVLRRSYGMDCHVYMQGPEHFTMGRELFIRPEQTQGFGKFTVLADGALWYIGPGLRWRSERRGILADTITTTTTVPASIRIDMAANRPFGLQAELASGYSHALLGPGSIVTPLIKIGSQWVKMGPFSVDQITRPKSAQGGQLLITARSDACKRLAQWRSDASYDYWSQTKLSTNPKELAKMLRVSGSWEESGGQLSQEGLNIDGVCYANAKASRGSLMRGRFTPVAGDFATRFGVGVNFYKETKYDAAARLGIKAELVTEDQYGVNGIFAIWGNTEYMANPGVALYHVYNSTWEKLASWPLSIAGNTPYWLQVRFQEGSVRVSYRADSSNTWTAFGGSDCEVLDYSNEPWKRDQAGRGAIFLRPVTPYSKCYAFASDQDIIPVENNATFNGADIVQVDSERIRYTGKGPNAPSHNLAFVYGDLLASGTAPGSTWVNFANDRESARMIQTFSLTATSYVRALRVYAKKMNYPVDALHGGFWRGPVSEAEPLGAMVSEKTAPSEKVSAQGDWVTFKFNGQEIQSGDWFILARGDNPTHPISSTYYAAAKGAGSGAHLWDEQNDLWLNQNGSIAYEIYGAEAAPSQWYSIFVTSPAALDQTANIYNNMALVVTDGAGKDNCFKVVGYTARPGKPYIFYVDRNPEMLDETSVLSLVPTLLVSRTNQKLDRGADGTLPAAHGRGRQVDTWRVPPYVKCDVAEFFSSEPDLTLEDMARVIARKAGVRDVNTTGPNLYSGSLTNSSASWAGKNAIVDFSVTTLSTGAQVTVGARNSASGAADGVAVVLKETTLQHQTNGVARSILPLWFPPAGSYRVSIYNNILSIWRNGAFLHSFTLTEADAALEGGFIRVGNTSTSAVTFRASEPNTRVDNFILDAGRGGDQLLSELIGEKRFFFMDHGDGTLRLFQKRTLVNTSETAYNLAASEDETETDGQIATRVRLEGTDVSEKMDTNLMIRYGNLFYQANMYEINSPADAEYFAAELLRDFNTRTVSKRLSGAADPRIEPMDEIYVSINGNVKRVIVDGIGFAMNVTDQSAMLDMDIDGRVTTQEA